MVVEVIDTRSTFAAQTAPYNLRPTLASAYHPNHSTETAVICIFNDMISAIDQGHIGAVMLVDLPHSIGLPLIIKFLHMSCNDGSELLEVHLIGW